MKFYPYSGLKSNNLAPLLFASRLIAGLSYILFALMLLLFFAIPFVGSETIIKDLGGGITARSTTTDYTLGAVVGSIWSLVSAVLLLAFSGLCAAVVSFEYKYTTSFYTIRR